MFLQQLTAHTQDLINHVRLVDSLGLGLVIDIVTYTLNVFAENKCSFYLFSIISLQYLI